MARDGQCIAVTQEICRDAVAHEADADITDSLLCHDVIPVLVSHRVSRHAHTNFRLSVIFRASTSIVRLQYGLDEALELARFRCGKELARRAFLPGATLV